MITACSFCGRRESDVSKLVATGAAAICDRCVLIAYEALIDATDRTREAVESGHAEPSVKAESKRIRAAVRNGSLRVEGSSVTIIRERIRKPRSP
jgi:ATP-dependent protease Clp ATPase subunit